MEYEEILENLCLSDTRNPLHSDVYQEGDEVPPPRIECYCDNCFYGRDKLALALLEFMEAKLKNARTPIPNWVGEDAPYK